METQQGSEPWGMAACREGGSRHRESWAGSQRQGRELRESGPQGRMGG